MKLADTRIIELNAALRVAPAITIEIKNGLWFNNLFNCLDWEEVEGRVTDEAWVAFIDRGVSAEAAQLGAQWVARAIVDDMQRRELEEIDQRMLANAI